MKLKHILVIRLSAMGDVAMTVPVLQQLLQQNPDLQITVLTQNLFKPLFEPLERTNMYVAETKGRHKGLSGLFTLFKELKKQYRFDAVADLHNVLRSKLISFFFRVSGIKTVTIDKGRQEKKLLTRKKNKKLVQLKTSFQRYADVFTELGLSLALNNLQGVFPKQNLPPAAAQLLLATKKNICIAPFAKHKEKMYPLAKMKAVLKNLSTQNNLQLFLLGGGKAETAMLTDLEKEFPGSINLAGKFSFKEELAIISNMDAMVSMDSANMHLASLFGVQVISVWGATHPFAGFYGWNQPADNAVQIDLYCRPCSVFGNKPCYRGDHACMQQLAEQKIITKLMEKVK
ncbi:glycosyltransferase family 9 protein [Terrimonas pollutisoli]|uniref:glycosyltransferase family 9 protein n=1 Tax=Terrimonas pollutisoli TaxID=3034147 RepID=UPI0023ED4957|nr:glycosyltransferase family 9 protein [Terrimonas sp. H1YJ31]